MALTELQGNGFLAMYAGQLVLAKDDQIRIRLLNDFRNTFANDIRDWETRLRKLIAVQKDHEATLEFYDGYLAGKAADKEKKEMMANIMAQLSEMKETQLQRVFEFVKGIR